MVYQNILRKRLAQLNGNTVFKIFVARVNAVPAIAKLYQAAFCDQSPQSGAYFTIIIFGLI